MAVRPDKYVSVLAILAHMNRSQRVRCPDCGFTVRGHNHYEGANHKQGSQVKDNKRHSTGK